MLYSVEDGPYATWNGVMLRLMLTITVGSITVMCDPYHVPSDTVTNLIGSLNLIRHCHEDPAFGNQDLWQCDHIQAEIRSIRRVYSPFGFVCHGHGFAWPCLPAANGYPPGQSRALLAAGGLALVECRGLRGRAGRAVDHQPGIAAENRPLLTRRKFVESIKDTCRRKAVGRAPGTRA